MSEERYQYEPKLNEVFAGLLDQLANHETIKEYRRLEQLIADNTDLQELVEEIKAHQKEAVRFDHYDKPNATKEAKRLADEKQEVFDTHPLVIAYRESLVEANDLLQHVTKRLQKQVNDRLESQLDHYQEKRK